MKKQFWVNPYQTELETQVVSVEGARFLFAETIIFSFSGGQESDQAYINHLPVIASEMLDGLIYYTLPCDHDLKVGDKVLMRIDWKRRYCLMRLHFAAELVLELVTRKLACPKIGAHIAEDKARIDFIYDRSIASILPLILDEYNQIIQNDYMIKTGFEDEISQRRYWEIKGFTRVSCGGTHVKSTREVGLITVKRINIGKGKERIEIKLLDSGYESPYCISPI